jgi:dihydropteroate synthase
MITIEEASDMSSMTATPVSVVALKRPERPIIVGGHEIPVHRRTVVMGILNVTPDSFSDGGRYVDLDRAVAHARQMVAEGADIIDIGGESTRPGHKPVPVEEELKRVIPVIERVSREVNVPISIDTYKAETARQALKAGAHIVNDVWGFKQDPDMAKVVAEFGVPVILMHNREQATYDSLLDDIVADLRESIQIGRAQGVQEEQIILDPGIGFAKTYEENLTVMRHLETITSLGYPVLLGTSRKSMIGKTLDLPVNERVEGTAATVALGIAKGCSIIRVHDVQPMVRVARMMDAMLYGPDAPRG